MTSVVHFKVKAPKIPAIMTQTKKNTLIDRELLLLKAPQVKPAAMKLL